MPQVDGRAWPVVLRSVIVQADGLFTWDVYARYQLQMIAGGSLAPRGVAGMALLDIVSAPERWRYAPLIWVPQASLRRQLGLQPGVMHISHAAMQRHAMLAELRHAWMSRADVADRSLPAGDRVAIEVYERFLALGRLLAQQLYVVPPAPGEGEGAAWRTILNPAGYTMEQQIGLKRVWFRVLTAARAGDVDAVYATCRQLEQVLYNMNPQARLLYVYRADDRAGQADVDAAEAAVPEARVNGVAAMESGAYDRTARFAPVTIARGSLHVR